MMTDPAWFVAPSIVAFIVVIVTVRRQTHGLLEVLVHNNNHNNNGLFGRRLMNGRAASKCTHRSYIDTSCAFVSQHNEGFAED